MHSWTSAHLKPWTAQNVITRCSSYSHVSPILTRSCCGRTLVSGAPIFRFMTSRKISEISLKNERCSLKGTSRDTVRRQARRYVCKGSQTEKKDVTHSILFQKFHELMIKHCTLRGSQRSPRCLRRALGLRRHHFFAAASDLVAVGDCVGGMSSWC